MRTNARAIHGSRFLVYALAGGLLAAAALWSSIARGADLAGPVQMTFDDAATCARFRAAGAAVAGVAPCSVGLGRLRYNATQGAWIYRPAKWLEARWAATPSPRPTPTITPRPTASPRPTEVDACPGGCMVYDFALRKASCLRPCPE